ncbi:MAG TPA: septation protein A [Methylophilaceae bacterium]|nr:septation protein A [Methylophilaceae bacterium]
MKFLFDMFPVILFFVAYKMFDIYVATAVAIAATLAQMAWTKFKGRKIDNTMITSAVIIVVFGGATLFLHDESYIKIKPTVLYWLFAVGLVVANAFFKKNLVRGLMEHQISMPDRIWDKLNLAWAIFFALLGALNLYFALNFSTDAWVDFKLFGTMGLMFLFFVGQAFVLDKHMTAKDTD